MRRRVVLSNLDPRSVARTMALVYGAIGLIVGVFMLLVSLARGDAAGVMAAFLMVFLYPIGSFLGGWLMAWLFNAVARRWGGVEMELDEPA